MRNYKIGLTFDNINKYYGQVVENGLTMDVEGTSYTDVVKFELESHTSNSLYPSDEYHTTTTTYYLAPKVATIQTEIYDELFGSLLTTTTLMNYEF